MKPARIAFIGQRGVPATIGGVEHHVEEIGSRLVARGHDVTVYTRANYTTSRVTEHRGMRVRYVPTAPTKHLEALVHSGLSTATAMLPGAQRADILHYHAIGPSVFTPLPRVLSRRGVVLTVHGLDYERDKWGVGARTALRSAGWISAHVPHATITVSKNLADFYLRRYGRVAHYIPNGVAIPVHREPRLITERFGLRGGDYALFLGRLVPEKAPDLLLRAFRTVDTESRLVIAGGSSFTDRYVQELESLAARDPRVLMVGPVQGTLLDELYSNAALFVLPSSLEGLALTLLEAASYGLPLVASDIPPNREVIGIDRPGGRLFPSGDQAALADAIASTLRARHDARADARLLGDRITREYDWDEATEATEAVYERVLGR
ncbi:MAG: glycosyltransferase family 4 protein [Candidatus Dormiibacterota bacterium]